MENDKSILYIVAIVAMVSIVALSVVVVNAINTKHTYSDSNVATTSGNSDDNLAGNAAALSKLARGSYSGCMDVCMYNAINYVCQSQADSSCVNLWNGRCQDACGTVR
jgi:hypothetical protein